MDICNVLNLIRARRIERQVRMDEEPDDWITVKGNHIPIDEDDKPIGGQIKVFGGFDDEKFRALERKTEAWEKDHPFDPFKELMGEDDTPDYVKEYYKMLSEKEEHESKSKTAESERVRKEYQKKVESWESEHKPEEFTAKRLGALNKYGSKIGYNVVSRSLAEDFSDEEIHEIIDKIDEMYSEFGIDKDNQFIYGIGSANENQKEQLDGMAGSAMIDYNMQITLDPRKRYEYSNREKSYDMIYHEAAHGIDMMLSEMMGNSVKSQDTAKAIVEDALSGMNSGGKNIVLTNLSLYAGRTNENGEHNYREVLAECIGDYMKNKDGAKDISKAVVESLKGYIRRYCG